MAATATCSGSISHVELCYRACCADAYVAACILQYDFARTGGGTDVPVTGRPPMDMALIRPDGRRFESSGVIGSGVGERDDMERRQWRGDAYPDFSIVRSTVDAMDTTKDE